jgi:archaemetzincin
MKFLYVGATPEVEREAFEAVRDRLAGEFGVSVRELALPAIEFAFDAARRQYGSAGVLEMLMRICPEDALKLLAVTERDLFIPVLTFVYGHAQLGGRVAAISLARLRQEFYGLPPNREVFLERAHKEALHETGHTFGLVHCADRQCAMALATNIRQIDGKRAAFCAACAARLRVPLGPAPAVPRAPAGAPPKE